MFTNNTLQVCFASRINLFGHERIDGAKKW